MTIIYSAACFRLAGSILPIPMSLFLATDDTGCMKEIKLIHVKLCIIAYSVLTCRQHIGMKYIYSLGEAQGCSIFDHYGPFDHDHGNDWGSKKL